MLLVALEYLALPVPPKVTLTEFVPSEIDISTTLPPLIDEIGTSGSPI